MECVGYKKKFHDVMHPFPAPPPSRLEFSTIAARGVSHLQQGLQIEVSPWSPVLDMQRTVCNG